MCPVGIAQHVIQRGNNRQVCFASEQDFAAYANWLKAYAKKFQVDLHAWVLMTNHVHLLCTPRVDNAVSHLMQALGRQYVRYFNLAISTPAHYGKGDLSLASCRRRAIFYNCIAILN